MSVNLNHFDVEQLILQVNVAEIASWDRRKGWREVFDDAISQGHRLYPDEDPWRLEYHGILAVVRQAAAEALQDAVDEVHHDGLWHSEP